MKLEELGLLRCLHASILAMVVTCLSVSCGSTRRSEVALHGSDRPLAVLLYANPFDVNQPTPLVAVYESGEVVFSSWGKVGGRSAVRQQRASVLSITERDALRRQVHDLVALRPRRSYKALDDHHVIMDASTARIYARDGRRGVITGVYALEQALRWGNGALRPMQKAARHCSFCACMSG